MSNTLRSLAALCLLLLPIGLQAQSIIETHPSVQSAQASVGRPRNVVEDIAQPYHPVLIEARHCQFYIGQAQRFHTSLEQAKLACAADPSTLYRSELTHNLRTNAGGDAQASQMGNTATQAAACNYIALTNAAITPGVTDTTLTSEIAVNGLSRAQGTYAANGNHTTFTIAKTFTASGAQSAQASGLFNASSTGTLCFDATFTSATLALNDTLSVTWTINY